MISDGQSSCLKCGLALAPESVALNPAVASVRRTPNERKPPNWPKVGLGFVLFCVVSVPSTIWVDHERRMEQAREVERQAQLAQLPGLKDTVRAGAARGDWDVAASAYERLRTIDPNAARELSAEAAQIESGVARREAERREAERKQRVATALSDAAKLVKDKELCDTPSAIQNVWVALAPLTPADTEYATARALAPKLELCRLKAKRALNNDQRDASRQQRIGIRSRLDKHFHDQSLDVDVTVHGTSKDQVTLSNLQFDNPAVVQRLTQEGGILQTLRATGFQGVTFSNGLGKSTYLDLEPDLEDNVGARTLTEMGLGTPLTL